MKTSKAAKAVALSLGITDEDTIRVRLAAFQDYCDATIKHIESELAANRLVVDACEDVFNNAVDMSRSKYRDSLAGQYRIYQTAKAKLTALEAARAVIDGMRYSINL